MSAEVMTAGRERLTPVAASERVELIDVLRGFALLGILVVNFWGVSGDSVRAVDKIVSEGLDILVSDSFYPLFSFLFGLGFAVQLLRGRERGAGVVGVYLRRMLVLFLIGSFHAVIIWRGDILVDYAIAGLLLIPLHRLRDRWLLPIALLPLVLGLYGERVRSFAANIGGGPRAAEIAELRTITRFERKRDHNNVDQRMAAKTGVGRAESFAAAVALRWHAYAAGVRSNLSRNFVLNEIICFFILGLIVGRRRILQEAERHRQALAWTMGVTAAVAIAGGLVAYLVEPEAQPLERLGWYASDYGTTAFYIAAISLAFISLPRAAARLRIFAAPGKIGLTNYLMASVVMTMLFSRYGAGLREPTTTIWVLMNLAFFFGVQVPFSRWWVAHFRFGPAEWLWRSVTYGARQPMRLEASAPAADRAAGGVNPSPSPSTSGSIGR